MDIGEWLGASSAMISTAAIISPLISRLRTQTITLMKDRLAELERRCDECEKKSDECDRRLEEKWKEIQWMREHMILRRAVEDP